MRYERTAPTLVVVDTDAADRSWTAGIVEALRPDLLWAAVDAAHKAGDVRGQLAPLGRVDALAVCGAARTTSPATTWELGVPVALLDDRPASRGAWLALLLDKLADLER